MKKENLYRNIYFPDGNTNCPLEFSPQEDITAYELALLLPLILRKNHNLKDLKDLKDKIDLMPINIRRHLK